MCKYLSSTLGAKVMATIASNAGMLGMIVVSRAVYALETELSWTVAATIMRGEHFAGVLESDGLAAVVSGVGSSHRATELTLSLSTRVGLQHTSASCNGQCGHWSVVTLVSGHSSHWSEVTVVSVIVTVVSVITGQSSQWSVSSLVSGHWSVSSLVSGDSGQCHRHSG